MGIPEKIEIFVLLLKTKEGEMSEHPKDRRGRDSEILGLCWTLISGTCRMWLEMKPCAAVSDIFDFRRDEP